MTKHRVKNPFLEVDEVLNKFKSEKFDSIVVDFHAETTAEKAAMGQYLD
jgi:calcineurin-like phosphoesterase